MPMRFVLDRVEGCRARNTALGIEIVRRCTVFDIPVYSSATAYMVLIDIIADPKCPRLREPFPDPRPGAFLAEHIPVAIEAPKRRVEMDLVYRGIPVQPSGGTGQISWLVQDTTLTNHITTYATAGGKLRLETRYKPGTANGAATIVSGIQTPPDPAAGVAQQNAGAHKITCYRGLRVTGRATAAQWRTFRGQVRGAVGKIHSDVWGGYSRGTWLFLGPNTTTVDLGNTFDVELTFIGEDKGHFPIVIYTDPTTGQIPKDISTEYGLRLNGLPPEGGWIAKNGVTLASSYEETPFTPIFNFTPDTAPTPG